jgi:hypothetical protein
VLVACTQCCSKQLSKMARLPLLVGDKPCKQQDMTIQYTVLPLHVVQYMQRTLHDSLLANAGQCQIQLHTLY